MPVIFKNYRRGGKIGVMIETRRTVLREISRRSGLVEIEVEVKVKSTTARLLLLKCHPVL